MSQPNNNNDTDEGVIAHILRVCKNSCTKCFGVVQTTDEYAKIKYKEHQIETRKKQFGVDYFQLLKNPNATEAEKQACIDAVLNDTAAVTKEIEALRLEIERVNQATNEKILPKPGAPVTAAATTTTAPTVAKETATVEAPTTAAPAAAAPITTDVEVTDPTMVEVPLTTPATN